MEAVNPLYADHSRIFSLGGRPFVSVYPVLSRRAGGLSVGINLNLDKGCNYDCIYCQVDRTGSALSGLLAPFPEGGLPAGVVRELGLLFDALDTGRFFSLPPFDRVPERFRVVRDVAFSGDGEPTLSPDFRETASAVRTFLSGRARVGSPPLLRLITNGTGLFSRTARTFVRETFLDPGPGEIWLKLDCGDPEHFSAVNRSTLSYARMMEGLEEIALELPVTVQTMVLDYLPPSGASGGFRSERSFWNPLRDTVLRWSALGAPISAWHLYTVARSPAMEGVRKVPAERLESWAEEVRPRLPFPVLVFS